MYSAQCPCCGATLTTNVYGQVWLGCQTCHWYGMVQTAGVTPMPPAKAAQASQASHAQALIICPACLRTTYGPHPFAIATWSCSACGYTNAASPTPPAPPTTPAATTQPATPATMQATPAQMRDEARELVFALAGDIAEALRDLPDADWRLSVAAAYERLQEAHTPLYEALGGRHMGDYAPDTHHVHRAVVATM